MLPLEAAIEVDDWKIVLQLLRLFSKDEGVYEKCLHTSSMKGREKIVRQLLQFHKVDIEAKTATGMTALDLAVTNGHMEIKSILIDAGACPTLKSAFPRR